MREMKINKDIRISTVVLFFLSSCSLSPGMHLSPDNSWITDKNSIYIESLQQELKIEQISMHSSSIDFSYKIGNGDQLAITIWGLPDIFPITNINQDQNLRRVDAQGNIFFPYIGLIKAEGKNQDQLRDDMSESLSKYFNDPQLDVSIAKFNSQKIYLLGEVMRPTEIAITDIPLSLSNALGESYGINNNTANGAEVFVIRQGHEKKDHRIFIADLSSPAGFLEAGNFYMENNDIVYVNAKGTARWNRVISQFFPFSTFLNSIDNLTDSD